jgi:hypothetical protein
MHASGLSPQGPSPCEGLVIGHREEMPASPWAVVQSFEHRAKLHEFWVAVNQIAEPPCTKVDLQPQLGATGGQ